MPRELITIQVGQCGNQIGCRFWDLALREHAFNTKNATFNEPLSSFFRNVDTRYEDPLDIPVGDGTGKIRTLKARAVLIDMEEGVLNETLKGPLADLFDTRQLIRDVSGAGNNWAHGHEVYGRKYEEEIVEKVRRPVEFCDSLQSFFLIHSMGGGTGSGLGTRVTGLLEEHFPDVYRFTTAVFPSADDDVVTSPYNSVLALNELAEHSDCVLPIENQALLEICSRAEQPAGPSAAPIKSTITGEGVPSASGVARPGAPAPASSSSTKKPFDAMNAIAGHLLINLTASMRFEGPLNVDLNEITMNLVPYPRLHFLVSALAPLHTLADLKRTPRNVDSMFSEVVSRGHQLIRADPWRSRYLACGFLVRGDVQISDVNRNIARLRPDMDMIYWNQDGFKVGLCSVPPQGAPYAVLSLANNCCVAGTFGEMTARFRRLYKRKVYVHHYTQYMEEGRFEDALHNVDLLVQEYEELARAVAPPQAPRPPPPAPFPYF
eukprot:tig00021127_g18827.t1